MSTNEHYLISAFRRLIASDTLGQSYLLFGPNTATRSVIGEQLLALLENNQTPLIDGQMIDAKNEAGIDMVRNIITMLWQKPLRGKRKSVLVNSAESLTPESQNALLKIVEEPPREALIILSVNDPSALIAPLVSRCERIYVGGSAAAVDQKEEKRAKEFIATTAAARKAIIKKIIDDDEDIGKFIEAILAECIKEPVKHWKLMRVACDRFAKITQYNTNKKLQLETLVDIR